MKAMWEGREEQADNQNILNNESSHPSQPLQGVTFSQAADATISLAFNADKTSHVFKDSSFVQ